LRVSASTASPKVSLALSASAAAVLALVNCFKSILFNSRSLATSRLVGLSLFFTPLRTPLEGFAGDTAARNGDANSLCAAINPRARGVSFAPPPFADIGVRIIGVPADVGVVIRAPPNALGVFAPFPFVSTEGLCIIPSSTPFETSAPNARLRIVGVVENIVPFLIRSFRRRRRWYRRRRLTFGWMMCRQQRKKRRKPTVFFWPQKGGLF
jgi:hypothetical protein